MVLLRATGLELTWRCRVSKEIHDNNEREFNWILESFVGSLVIVHAARGIAWLGHSKVEFLQSPSSMILYDLYVTFEACMCCVLSVVNVVWCSLWVIWCHVA